jgi:hypothetical protein
VMQSPLEEIRQRLSRRILPRDSPARMWAGPGTDQPCDGCDRAIGSNETEHEVEVSGRAIRLHRECFLIWEAERRVDEDAT